MQSSEAIPTPLVSYSYQEKYVTEKNNQYKSKSKICILPAKLNNFLTILFYLASKTMMKYPNICTTLPKKWLKIKELICQLRPLKHVL